LDRHVVLHHAAAEDLRKLGVMGEKIVVMQPSIDAGLFTPASAGPEEAVVGFVGRLEEPKGIAEVPRVLAALPHVRIELIGPSSEEERKALLEAAKSAGVLGRLKLLGEVPPETVAERMRGWQVLLLPSYSEGFPLVAIEAAAARLPVAAVEAVLPDELTRQPGIHTGPRKEYVSVVQRALEAGRSPVARWVQDHTDGAKAWDTLFEDLSVFAPRPRVSVDRFARFRRLHPVRKVGRPIRDTLKRLSPRA
jgi:glycosyltransferase involved in cell wall biosynthesis